MGISWTTSNEKRVMLLDFRGLKVEKDMISLMQKGPEEVKNLPDGDDLRVLVDVTGTYATPGFMETARKLEKAYERFKLKRAILGIEGSKAVLLKGFNLFAKNPVQPFATREEAMKYLSK